MCTTIQRTLVKWEPRQRTGVAIDCKTWTCPECGELRKKQLIASGFGGKPETFLTLTSRRSGDRTANGCAYELARAWRLLRLRIMRGKPEKDAHQARVKNARLAGQKPPPKPKQWPFLKGSKPRPLPFLAVFEATKTGWPHLHILMRSRFIPQEWISAEMEAITGSPVVWIERISDLKKVASYIVKYCGKNPHRFGTTKRYWQSKDFALAKKPPRPDKPALRAGWEKEDIRLAVWADALRQAGWNVRYESVRCACAQAPP